MFALRLALSISHEDLWREVARSLPELRAQVVADGREHASWGEFLERLKQVQPHLVLLDVTAPPAPLEDAVAGIRIAASASVAALNVTADPESILRSVRAGANDYLYPPLGASLHRLVERKLQEVRAAERPRTRGKVLAWLSAKGGCGATTIACSMAGELARRSKAYDRSVLVADFDLNAGVAAQVLHTTCSHSILDAVRSLYRLDTDAWDALVAPAGKGLEILSAPPLCSPQEAFSPDSLRQLLDFARSRYEWVLADLGRGWSALAFDLIGMADLTFLIFTADVPALNQTCQMAALLRQHGIKGEVRLVLNQANTEMDLSAQDIERIMGLPVFAVLPRAHADGHDDLLALAGPLGRQLRDLAQRVT